MEAERGGCRARRSPARRRDPPSSSGTGEAPPPPTHPPDRAGRGHQRPLSQGNGRTGPGGTAPEEHQAAVGGGELHAPRELPDSTRWGPPMSARRTIGQTYYQSTPPCWHIRTPLGGGTPQESDRRQGFGPNSQERCRSGDRRGEPRNAWRVLSPHLHVRCPPSSLCWRSCGVGFPMGRANRSRRPGRPHRQSATGIDRGI